MKTPDLKDRIILITGAGSGLGHHLAVSLGACGATIAVNDINPDRSARTTRMVEEVGGRAKRYIADIAKKFPVQAMFNEIEDDWGRLDAIVNNARVVPHKPLLDMDEWDWRRTIDVNLTGAFVLAQVGGRIMRASGRGIFIQPLQVQTDNGNTCAYQASFGGLERLTTSAAAEFEVIGLEIRSVRYQDDDYTQAIDTIVALLGK